MFLQVQNCFNALIEKILVRDVKSETRQER